MSDPNQPGGMSVTLKADEPGGKYNDAKSPGTWIVFHGPPAAIREQILETFTFDEGAKDLDLAGLVVEATRMFKAVFNVAGSLGGRVLGGQGESQNEGSSSAWAEARGEAGATEEQKAEPATLADLIEQSTTVQELKELWMDRSYEIKSESLVEAWAAKGKALKDAAA